jgi:hypothetical protein
MQRDNIKSMSAKLPNHLSVRYDEKIPKDVFDRLQEIANICELVAQHFSGDVRKTALWFKTKNPLFGNIAPRDMIRYGRYERLRRFITEAIAENAAAPSRSDPAHVEATSIAATQSAVSGREAWIPIYPRSSNSSDSARLLCINGKWRRIAWKRCSARCTLA